MPRPNLVHALARAFLAGRPNAVEAAARATRTLGRPWRWLQPLARRYVEAFAGRPRPRRREVVQFLRQDRGFRRAWLKYADELSVAHWIEPPQEMQPVPAAAGWRIPPIESIGDLADWLALTPAELDWFADLRDLTHQPGRPRLEHYHYRLLTKRYGNIRLIEAPKPRLKAIQQQILARILDPIPAHPAAHGFVKGRSIRTFVAPHVGKRVVLRMDLEDFFPSIPAARIQAFFRTAGYPESVADRLAGLCTNAAPRTIWKTRDLYGQPHLPQGAPPSPSLANLCLYRADCRLAGLAQSARAVYSRYADDLAFSGGLDFERRVDRFSTHVAAILSEEGFRVHHRKTRVMRQGVRQHLAGLVANRHVNVMRPDFDLLKAILTNCVRHGSQSQNREQLPDFRAHLAGRVAFVESIHPAHGQKLRAIFDRIAWS